MTNNSYIKPFNFNLNDIQFLQDQIKFRPLFYISASGLAPVINWNGAGAIYDQFGSLLWDGTTQIAGMTYISGTTTIDPASAIGIFGSSYSSMLDISGLREVTGRFNNLVPGHANWGAIDQPFMRLANSDASHYSSLDTLANISEPVATGNTIEVQTSQSIVSDLQHNTAMVDVGNGRSFSVNYDTWLNTTTLTTTDNTVTDGHHKLVTSTVVSTTTDISTQSFYQDATGVHAIGDPMVQTPNSSNTSTVLSDGELDAAFHAQLGAYDPRNPGAYVSGLVRDANTHAVDLTAAKNFDYTVSFADKTTATPTMNSVIDYTPRMISNLVASGGVVTLKDGQNHRVDWNAEAYANTPAYTALIDDWNAAHPKGTPQYIDMSKLVEGAAIVTDWGLVGANGGSDMQNPNNSEVYIGAANPGIAATNGIFTLFGQFFDHGLDFIGKASTYKVVIPLAVDDPLYGVIGADGQPTTSITITRATVSGQDANGNANYVNHDSPYIDQNQTYGAVDDITNILRAWVKDPNTGAWHPGARLLDGTSLANTWTDAFGNTTKNTLPTLNELRAEIRHNGGSDVGGARADLSWDEVAGQVLHRNVDGSLAHDTLGNTISTGQPLLLDMNPTFNAAHISSTAINELNSAFGSNFSTDYIVGTPLTLGSLIAAGWLNPSDFSINKTLYGMGGTPLTQAQHDAVSEIMMESVGDHYVAGDGRANENFGLTSIHHVFHEEHEFQVQNLEAAIIKQDASNDPTHATAHNWQVAVNASDVAAHDGLFGVVGAHFEAKAGVFLARDANGDYFVADGTANDQRIASYALDIDGHKISAAGSYTTADGYISWDTDKVFNGAKLTVEMEYQHAAVDQYARAVSPNIQEFAGTSSGENAAVTLEYAQSIFRFGHSQLRETIDTMDPTGGVTGKIMSYALEAAFLQPGKFADVGPGSIIMGMERQQSNEIDEFITPALQQGLLGQPLDLATINIARGRDLNIPNLNAFREAIGFTAYSDWLDFKANMFHPDNLVNFIAAYSFDGDVAHAKAMLDAYQSGTTASYTTSAGVATSITSSEASDWLHTNKDIDKVDLWLGGLAEVHVSGGVLGETFDAVFVAQITKLMDDDRFYYLQRLINQQFGDEMINEQFKDIFERTTGTQHLNGNIFGYADAYYDFGQKALDANGVAIDASSSALASAMAQQHKYGQIIDAHTADNGGHGLGIWSDNAASVADNGHTMLMTAPQPPSARDAGPMSSGEPPAPASIAKLYVFDGRPDVTGASTNADGTAQSGFDSSEVVVGSKYDDFIRLGPADDTAYGNDGNDIIYGGSPTTSASAGGASGGLDHLYGGAGNDILYGEDMPDLMDGGAGDDWLYGGSSGSSINGVDQLAGSEGNDHLYGGAGIDKLYGGLGDDYIYGGDDTDPFMSGGDGNDYMNGGSGQDILYGGNGSDILDGGKGIDLLYGDGGDDILRPGDGDSQIAGNGGGGDDLIGGDGVVDTGFDLADYSQQTSASGVDIDLTAQFAGLLPADLTPQPPNVTAAITTINVLSQLEGVIGTKNNDHLVGDSPGDATAAVSNGNNWLIGGSGNDSLEGRGGNDVIIGGSIRLDTLIGSYSGGYYNDTTTTVDGASHKATGALSGGLLDVASTGGVTFEKHFTELSKSAAYKDFVLGDGGSDGTLDKAIYSGNRLDYTVEKISYNSGNADGVITAYKITDIGGTNADGTVRAPTDGVDLLVGVDQVSFNGVVYSINQLFNHVPTGSVGSVGGVQTISGAEVAILTPTSALFDADNITPLNPLGAVTIPSTGYNWQSSSNGTLWSDIGTGAGANQQGAITHLLSEGTTSPTGVLVHVTASYTDNAGTVESVASPTWNLIVGSSATADTLTGADKTDGNGGTFSDVIFGLNGNDVITGGAGIDRLDGGGGADLYIIASAGDHSAAEISDTGTSGTDELRYNGVTAATLTLFAGDTGLEAITIGTGTATNANITGTTAINVDASALNYDVSITGNAGANIITGGSGNNTILGFAGADTINGGAGVDTLVLTATAATLNTATDGQLVNLEAVSASTSAAGVTISLANQTEGFFITGGVFSDSLTGGSGDDTFNSFAGADTINGGAGVDTLVLTGTSASLNAATDGQLVNVEAVSASAAAAGVTITLANQTEGLVITGSNSGDALTGGSGADTFNGFAGADTINGGAGVDTLVLTATSASLNAATNGQVVNVEVVSASAAATGVIISLANQTEGFSIIGGAFADTLTGGAGADNISSGVGNDNINGFVGADTIDGGADFDTLILTGTASNLNTASNAQLVNVEAVSASTAAAGVTINLANQTEGFAITGSASADVLTGGAGADNISAGAGNDIINGFAGADSIDGGTGADTLVLTVTSATLNTASDTQLLNVEAVSASTATVGVIIVLANQTEGLVITGSASADALTGGSSDDTFSGFAGADTINGGAGVDTLLLTATSAALNTTLDGQLVNLEAVTASAAAGGVTINLANQTEGFSITGGGFADILTGGSGADTFNGFVGADTINGGAGVDTLFLTATSTALNSASNAQLVNVEAITASTLAAGVTINLANQTEGFALTGSAFADTLTGGSGADNIKAGDGADSILGFVGADTIDGGAGVDTLVLTATSTTLNSAMDGQLVNLEAVSASTATAGVTISLANQTEGFSITGSGSADALTGGLGADTFNGFSGADTINGGGGLDTLILTATAASLNTATDTQLVNLEAVSASTAAAGVTINLANQTEGFSITGSASADTLTGGSGADNISAGIGNDTINGFVGADTIDGGSGSDTLVLTATATTLNTATDSQLVNVEAVSASTAAAGVMITLANQTEGFSITGSGSADTLTGGSGDDIIIGGNGRDTLTGNAGSDTFVFRTAAEAGNGTGTGVTNADLITDFVSTATSNAVVDKIDLSLIDANALSGGQQHFVWDDIALTGNAMPAAGHVGYHYEGTGASAVTVIDANINQRANDTTVDFQIKLAGTIVLHASDFIL